MTQPKPPEELERAAYQRMTQAVALVGNPFGSNDRQRDFQAAMDAVAEYADAAGIGLPEAHAVMWDLARSADAVANLGKMSDAAFDRLWAAVSSEFERRLQVKYPDDWGMQRMAWEQAWLGNDK